MDSIALLKHMPDYYLTSDLTRNILLAIANEFNGYAENCKSTQNELTIYNASSTLDKYEKDFVLPISNNYEREYRISKIISKLRGQGIITDEKIKDIVEAYSNGECEITKTPSEFTLKIKFIGIKGIPPNINDLKAILSRLKAADWQIIYEYSYLTWNERDSLNLTWAEWSSLNLTWDEYEVYQGKEKNNV